VKIAWGWILLFEKNGKLALVFSNGGGGFFHNELAIVPN
jgi:hypothetical protein